jgi:hypothetical protein
MGHAEMHGLARRLRARADSVLLNDQPEQQRDLRQAADLLDILIHYRTEVRRAADSTTDEPTAQHLRELLGGL